MKKKLELDLIEIKSFVTAIKDEVQRKLIGGTENVPNSIFLVCPTEGNVSECGASVRKDCGMFVTKDDANCEDLLN